MKAHSLKVQRTAHYYTIGTPGKHIKRFWLVCHGYGQAAGKFIYKFDGMDDGQTLIVAAEGLSRFYFGGFTGEVGASWMTKEDRQDEIEDYLNLLQTLYDQFVPQLADDVQITLMGFSQGGVTITRFALLNQPLFHHLILWGCDFAHDIDYIAKKDFITEKQLFMVIGKEDQFVTPERMEKYKAFATKQQLEYELIQFDGKHEVDRKILYGLAERLS